MKKSNHRLIENQSVEEETAVLEKPKKKKKSSLSLNVKNALKQFRHWNSEKFFYNKLRMNYRLYARHRQIKYEEKVGIYEGSNIGVKIDWDKFGYILEEKHRRIQGDNYIITEVEKKKEVVERRFNLKRIVTNTVDMVLTSLGGGGLEI